MYKVCASWKTNIKINYKINKMKESITNKLYRYFDEIKFDHYSILNSEIASQIYIEGEQEINKFFSNVTSEAKSSYPLRNNDTSGYGIYVGLSNEEKLKLRNEKILEKIQTFDNPGNKFSKNNVLFGYIFQRYITATSNYFKKLGKKEQHNIDNINCDLKNLYNKQFKAYKLDLKNKHEFYESISKKIYKFLRQETLTDDSVIVINSGSIESIRIKFGEYKNGVKVINSVTQSNGLSNDSVNYYKQMDARNSSDDFYSLNCITEGKFIKIVFSQNNSTLLERTVIHIKTQIKKVNIINERVIQIYQNGFSEPEKIVFKDFESALEFEEMLSSIQMNGCKKLD